MSRAIVAVAQIGSVLFDTPATLDRLETQAREAAGGGARLVVFPEALVGGYPKGVDFGARVGMRSAEGRDWFRRYYESAIDISGPECARIGALARELALHVVVGVIERSGATLYCTSLAFDASGEIAALHRKLMPTAMERLIWGMGDGSTLPVIETPLGRLGMAICWENYMPMLRMAMYAQGVELYCAPTVDDRDSWTASMRHIAMEGRCFVLCASQYLRRSDAPADYHPIQGEAPETELIRGGSMIVGPLGQVLAGPLFGAAGVLVAEIDRLDLARARMDFDAVGHYARADVFQLSVNTAPQAAVAFIGGSESEADGA